MSGPTIKIQYLTNAYKRESPETHDASQRIELLAAIEDPIVLRPRERATIGTGLALELPSGWEAQIHPLPSMALAHGVTVLNSPGTIDPDYRGEVKVILINLGERAVTIERGAPIAVMSFSQFTRVVLVKTEKLQGTERSTRGLGSTGQ